MIQKLEATEEGKMLFKILSLDKRSASICFHLFIFQVVLSLSNFTYFSECELTNNIHFLKVESSILIPHLSSWTKIKILYANKKF